MARPSDRWRVFDINCGRSDGGCWCCTSDGALSAGDGLVQSPIQSPKAADAIKSNRGFSGLRKPFGTQREGQEPKIAAHPLYEQRRQVPWYLWIAVSSSQRYQLCWANRETSWFFSPVFTNYVSPSLHFVLASSASRLSNKGTPHSVLMGKRKIVDVIIDLTLGRGYSKCHSV